MKELIISKNEAGQRLDKLLKKYLSEAPGGFIYKMLRKKNIVLNHKRAAGKEILAEGDILELYLSDNTIEKFRGKKESISKTDEYDLDIIYEDEHILLLNKPAGILSQKACASDISMVEYILSYLKSKGELSDQSLQTFRPSVCNRLDRNTTGLIAAGKSLAGLQMLSRIFKERTIKKYYLCFVKGKITKPGKMQGYLTKDERKNMVQISGCGDKEIETHYNPVSWNSKITLLRVHLITGKTHQIRAHLASVGHPILGDSKYGDKSWNQQYSKMYGVKNQQLHSYCMVFPDMDPMFRQVSGKTFYAKVPYEFWNIIKETIWEHGTQEALEVRH